MDGLVVVVKKVIQGKGTHFFTGGIKGGKFVRYRQIKKMADLKYRDEYVTLAYYLKSTGNKTPESTILKNLKVEKMYVRLTGKDKPVESTPEKPVMTGKEKADEKLFWADYYPDCKTCQKTCKQSHMLLSLWCPTRVPTTT